MSFSQLMNVVLPPTSGSTPVITGQYGESRGEGPHGGVDFKYSGGPTNPLKETLNKSRAANMRMV